MKRKHWTIKLLPFCLCLGIFSSTASSADQTVVTAGGDDTSYLIPDTTVVFNGITYTNSVYITTNAVLVFGTPMGTAYFAHPNYPSISFNSIDWVQYPNINSDEHLIIRTFGGGFEVDIAARLFPNNPTDQYFNPTTRNITRIVITASIEPNGETSYLYSVFGNDYSLTPDYWGNNQRTSVRIATGANLITPNDATWRNFRITRIPSNFLTTSINPELSLKDGIATCTSGDYKFAGGDEAEINSVVYTFYLDNEAVSRIAVDGDNSLAPHMFAPIAQTITGIAGEKSAAWNLTGKSNYSARCDVTVMKQGLSLTSTTEMIYDSDHYAAIAAKKAEEEKVRLEAVVANYTKEKREMRKRIRERAGN